jgi:glutaredoxin-like protein NrdH
MTITVYTKPACVQCTATKRALDKSVISYGIVDITEDERARDLIVGLGYSQAPVVIARDPDEHWCGFRPDRLAGQGLRDAPATHCPPDASRHRPVPLRRHHALV